MSIVDESDIIVVKNVYVKGRVVVEHPTWLFV